MQPRRQGCPHPSPQPPPATGAGERGSTAAPFLPRPPINLDLRAVSLSEGVRAALSVAIIIALETWLAWPPLLEAALGALLTCISDPGGPMPRRIRVLLSFLAAGTLIIFGVGLLRGSGIAVALPLGVAGLFCLSFLRIYGQPAQQAGGLLSVVLILALDRAQPDAHTAAVVAGAFAGGSLWALLLTMVIWRVYPYLPARRAVAETYRRLALFCADLLVLVRTDAEQQAWDEHARTHRGAVRAAIEAARGTVLDTLRARGPSSRRAVQTLIRLETAEQLMGMLIALSDRLEHGAMTDRRAGQRILRRLRPMLLLIGRAIVSDTPPRVQLVRATASIAADAAKLPDQDPLRTVTELIVERLRVLRTVAVPDGYVPGDTEDVARPLLRQRLLGPLRANLVWRSAALRHAVRAAIAAAPALAFTMLWFTPYDHWLTISIVASMQPYVASTYARALERAGGTALGGVIGAVVGLLATTRIAMAVAMFPLAMIALAVRAVSFGLYMTALTPLVVLLVETGAPGSSEWMVAGARVAFAVIGGIIAVAANLTLWPSREPERLGGEARAAIAAYGRFAEAELDYLLGDMPLGEAEGRRRAAGVAGNALEAAISRALIEPGGSKGAQLEAALVIDAALRRCGGRLSAIQHDLGMRGVPASSLRAWRDWIGNSMRKLGEGDVDLPPRPQAACEALARLARQVELMAGASNRLTP